MINFETFKEIALSFPESNEQLHFEKPSFRYGKKIFATYDKKNHLATLKLNEIDQSVFTAFNPAIIYPVPNNWGKQGWTLFDLAEVREDLFRDALQTAYQNVAKKIF